ncbi:MAG TPA: hypothetical protein VE861_12500, partial [Gemmatimonadaceae bacterium]|nr:hypothetical protein [Gemmatimonadaceae bacterium]
QQQQSTKHRERKLRSCIMRMQSHEGAVMKLCSFAFSRCTSTVAVLRLFRSAIRCSLLPPLLGTPFLS